MPSLILPTRKSVHIENCIDAFRSACLDYSVNQSETTLFDLEILLVVHEVAVVDWYPNAVNTERRKKLSIFPRKEVVKESIEEVVVLLLAKDFQ